MPREMSIAVGRLTGSGRGFFGGAMREVGPAAASGIGITAGSSGAKERGLRVWLVIAAFSLLLS
jgi:hypothetical protein